MSNDIRDVNMELLIGLKQHFDQAERLRALYERLLALARPVAADHQPTERQHRRAKK